MKYLGFVDIGTNICIGLVHIDLFHLGVIGLQISQNPVNYFSHHPYFWKQKQGFRGYANCPWSHM